ncbi:FH2 domain-containing protein 1 isoform X1 [Pangasianodon hypophthalmus]|uniref:FH2 domain-containing protein 1 isoform X1 n=2 Tax=Pangasianodon hypophthalmus TaxID=310915 RepID=UPI000F00BBDA|nr:FH2 domain-containing protein 1 isoform X1 [Pangasianodon hypophthalmus]
MSHISAANTEQDYKEGGEVISVFDHDTIVTPPPPAPPPPLPVGNIQRRQRIRSFYWKPIPEERIHQRGAPNLWTLAKHSDKHKFHIDIQTIEDLFGHNDRNTVATASNKTSRVYSSLSEQKKEISILDPKRSMNVAIFLKCFKKSIQSVIDDIVHGNSEEFGAERLRELNKLLPDTHEVEKLHSYKGDKTHLNTVDSFMYQLTLLPRFELRVEAMLLKEEFSALCSSLKQDVLIIHAAIRELLSCVELHSVLHLVLEAGNIINTGGYGGNAVGFKLSSLLSLAETKSNKPGMNLLHFVALEAQKKDDQLLKFPEKLQYVESAARVSVDSLDVELDNLNRRIKNLQQNIQSDTQLLQQLHTFLQCAAVSLKEVSVCHSLLKTEGDEMIDFFCEDRETFKLDECFYIFYHFCSKFTKAVQENVERAMRAESQLKRLKVGEEKGPSWAGQLWVGGVLRPRCSSEIDVRAAVKWEGLMELLNAQPPSSHNFLGGFGLHRPRQRLSGSNMNIKDTHTPSDTQSPSDTHSHSARMAVQVETHTLIPGLQNSPFKTLFHGHHGNDPTEISSSDVTNDEEFPHHDTDIKQLDRNRHMAMTSDPAQARLEVDGELVLRVESEVGLEVESDVGLGVEPEVVLRADSDVGRGAGSDVILGVELDKGRTLDLMNKHYDIRNEEGNSNIILEHQLIISPAAAETSTTASPSSQSELKTNRNTTESTNQDLDCKSTHHFLGSKEREKKRIQAVNSENTISPNNATSKSVNSFRKMPLKKSIVSPESSSSSSSPKLRPLHPVRTLTHTEKQSMRKVISVSSTKPHPIARTQSLKVPPPSTATSVHPSPTPKVSSIQKSLVRKPMIHQKSAPKEKICRSTQRILAMPTQESHTHTQKATPHFACSTVASTTRSAVTTSNTSLSQKDVSTTTKASSPTRTVPRRASELSLPSRTGSTDLPLPRGHITNFKVKPVRPAWR